jgi:hypothetical protein
VKVGKFIKIEKKLDKVLNYMIISVVLISKITLRHRLIKNDMESLQLDFYPVIRNPETMVVSRREYLGIYIYLRPKNIEEACRLIMKAKLTVYALVRKGLIPY